jgi:hypothetical protein
MESIRAIPGTGKELQRENRRNREIQERQAAMLSMENLEKSAARAVAPMRILSEDESNHFKAQLLGLETQVGSLPHIDTMLNSTDSLRRTELAHLDAALSNAKSIETRTNHITA